MIYKTGKGLFLLRRSPVTVIYSKDQLIDTGTYERYAVVDSSNPTNHTGGYNSHIQAGRVHEQMLQAIGTGLYISNAYSYLVESGVLSFRDVEVACEGAVYAGDLLVPPGREKVFREVEPEKQAKAGTDYECSVHTVAWSERECTLLLRPKYPSEGMLMLHALVNRRPEISLKVIHPSARTGIPNTNGSVGQHAFAAALSVLRYWLDKKAGLSGLPHCHPRTSNKEVCWKNIGYIPAMLNPIREKVPDPTAEAASLLGGLPDFTYEKQDSRQFPFIRTDRVAGTATLQTEPTRAAQFYGTYNQEVIRTQQAMLQNTITRIARARDEEQRIIVDNADAAAEEEG